MFVRVRVPRGLPIKRHPAVSPTGGHGPLLDCRRPFQPYHVRSRVRFVAAATWPLFWWCHVSVYVAMCPFLVPRVLFSVGATCLFQLLLRFFSFHLSISVSASKFRSFCSLSSISHRYYTPTAVTTAGGNMVITATMAPDQVSAPDCVSLHSISGAFSPVRSPLWLSRACLGKTDLAFFRPSLSWQTEYLSFLLS
jgi:hypothetical protein